jgi:hypothetical protein
MPFLKVFGGSGGGGGSTIIVEDEGIALGAFTTLNFVGAGVSAVDAGGGVANIVIPGGGGGTLTVTTDPALAAGQLVAFTTTGNVVLADSSLALSPDRYEVKGVATAIAPPGGVTQIYTDEGARVPVAFLAPPAAGANGSRVFLDTTAGFATLSVPPSGNALVKVGILVGADGLTATPDVVIDFGVTALIS